MTKYASLFLVIFLIDTAIAQNYALSDGSANNQPFSDFDWKLNKVLNEKEKGNFVVSPLSVKLALAMIYPGVYGDAAKEIEDSFQMNSNLKETIGQKFSSLMKSLQTNEKSNELNIGTTIYVNDDFQIHPNYSLQLQHDYNSSIQKVHFGSTEDTKAKINEWCSEATKGKIPKLLSGDEFNGDTAMMLLNAIFFKGEWQIPFVENKTKSEMFSVSSDKKVPVQMMSLQQTESFNYCELDEIKAQFIRLPYMGNKFAMYIVYPREIDGLDTLANGMNSQLLLDLTRKCSEEKINLKLPKFKFDSRAELIEVLKMLNITKIFEPSADLHLMGSSPSGSLKISEIIQKSGIDVNEKGSTAYAATEVVIRTKMGSYSLDISITHPFMFLIVDESQNNVIFIGKVVDPSSTSQEALSDLSAGNTGDGQQTRPINILFYIYTLILLKIFL